MNLEKISKFTERGFYIVSLFRPYLPSETHPICGYVLVSPKVPMPNRVPDTNRVLVYYTEDGRAWGPGGFGDTDFNLVVAIEDEETIEVSDLC